MAYLNWTRDLETGITVIDTDHKVLVDLLNQAHDCVGDAEESATLGSVLNALVDYTQYHFAREEYLMQAASFPEFSAHKARHDALSRRAREVRASYLENPEQISALEIMDFLRTWLIEHILKEDFRYRAAVMAHPDAIRAAETIGFDMTMSVTSPSAASAPPVAAEQDQGAASLADFTGLSVMVVDDNQNFQVILRTILKGLGCPQITLVNDGPAGLEMLDEVHPGLILVDWRMDGMDGLEFVRTARARGVSAPIIMISGYSEEGFSQTAHEAGVDAFLEKPITARNLLNTVQKARTGMGA